MQIIIAMFPWHLKNAASHCRPKVFITAHVLMLTTCELIIESMQVDFRENRPSSNHQGDIMVDSVHVKTSDVPPLHCPYPKAPSSASAMSYSH